MGPSLSGREDLVGLGAHLVLFTAAETLAQPLENLPLVSVTEHAGRPAQDGSALCFRFASLLSQ